jgi:arylsulfatase A-like enzyme
MHSRVHGVRCVLLIALLAWGPVCRAAVNHTNVVLVIADELGWRDLGANGNPHIDTPAVDRIAADGVSFSRFYASPVDSPTLASLMTGRYYLRTGVFDGQDGHETMRAEETTLAEVFQKAGYRTALFGKWHLGRYMKYHPNNQGFQIFFGFWQPGHIERNVNPSQLYQNASPVEARGHYTDLITDGAVSFIQANREAPFFLCLVYDAPQSPGQAPDALLEKYLKKGLPFAEAQNYARISHMDENLGRLTRMIEESGIRNNTVVLFTSDSGGAGRFFDGGLRGGRGSVHEGGIRVPFLARWPGHFPPGLKVHAMARDFDLFPTLCELFKLPQPAEPKVDGKSLLPLLVQGGDKSPHSLLFHSWNRSPNTETNWAVTSQIYKLANGQLFDLAADPGERTNVASKHVDVVSAYRSEFLKWYADVTRGQTFQRVAIEVGRPDENPVEIPAGWAELTGRNIRFTFNGYDWDTIHSWDAVGDMARWRMEVAHAGKYQVLMSYGCAPEDAGSNFVINAGNGQLSGVVQGTVGTNVFIKHLVGVIDMIRGPTHLEIRATTMNGKQLMALNRIWLYRLP